MFVLSVQVPPAPIPEQYQYLRKSVKHGVRLVLLQGVAEAGEDQHPHAHRHAQQQKLSVQIFVFVKDQHSLAHCAQQKKIVVKVLSYKVNTELLLCHKFNDQNISNNR